MRYSHEVTIPVPASAIDLPDWLFTLTEQEYHACQSGHRAIGVVGDREGMVNVESIGGSLIVQHYRTERAEPHHVTMVARASRAYVMHLVPVPVGVTWDMTIEPDGEQSRFRCTIAIDLPAAMRVVGPLSGAPYFVHKHLVEETHGFARDIARKAGAAAA